MRARSVHPAGWVAGLPSARGEGIRVPAHEPSMVGLLIANVLRGLWRLVVAAVRHPMVTTLCLALAAVYVVTGVRGLVLSIVAAGAALVIWRRGHPASFTRCVTSRYRWATVYSRRWQPAMVTCGLAARLDGEEYLPRIRRVVSSPFVDRVLVRTLPGQAPEDYDRQTAQLAHTFEATRCRIRLDRPGRVWLDFSHGDPLRDVLPPVDPQEPPDFTALPLGRQEDGRAWLLRLLGTHVLIAGASGSGKGSVLGSLLRALGPGIRDGSAQIWAIDPKGGMELTPASGLFARFAYDSPESMVRLLEDAVTLMRSRAEGLRRAQKRVHTPTVGDPLIVVVVDELAALTAYVGDRDLKRRAEAALQLLLSQGRAPGVLVVAAVQDPGKDVVAFRDLFTARIALRLLEDVQVDMVLGRSARLRGAECDQIPASLPGTGYVVREGIREPVRVRAAYLSDDDVASTVSAYAPPRGSEAARHLNVVDG